MADGKKVPDWLDAWVRDILGLALILVVMLVVFAIVVAIAVRLTS